MEDVSSFITELAKKHGAVQRYESMKPGCGLLHLGAYALELDGLWVA
jgi:hypothetical protein